MSAVVVDASLCLSLVYEDESSFAMEELLLAERDDELTLLAPVHWRIEVLSSLQRGARRKRIPVESRVPSFLLLSELPIVLVHDLPDVADLYRLADETSLSIYDGLYLWLAQKEPGCLVATADVALATAASRRGILWKSRGRRRRRKMKR